MGRSLRHLPVKTVLVKGGKGPYVSTRHYNPQKKKKKKKRSKTEAYLRELAEALEGYEKPRLEGPEGFDLKERSKEEREAYDLKGFETSKKSALDYIKENLEKFRHIGAGVDEVYDALFKDANKVWAEDGLVERNVFIHTTRAIMHQYESKDWSRVLESIFGFRGRGVLEERSKDAQMWGLLDKPLDEFGKEIDELKRRRESAKTSAEKSLLRKEISNKIRKYVDQLYVRRDKRRGTKFEFDGYTVLDPVSGKRYYPESWGNMKFYTVFGRRGAQEKLGKDVAVDNLSPHLRSRQKVQGLTPEEVENSVQRIEGILRERGLLDGDKPILVTVPPITKNVLHKKDSLPQVRVGKALEEKLGDKVLFFEDLLGYKGKEIKNAPFGDSRLVALHSWFEEAGTGRTFKENLEALGLNPGDIGGIVIIDDNSYTMSTPMAINTLIDRVLHDDYGMVSGRPPIINVILMAL